MESQVFTLRLYKCLDSFSLCMQRLGLAVLHVSQAFLLVLLGHRYVILELGGHYFKKLSFFVIRISGCHFFVISRTGSAWCGFQVWSKLHCNSQSLCFTYNCLKNTIHCIIPSKVKNKVIQLILIHATHWIKEYWDWYLM